MDREEAAKELMAMLEEAQEGPYYSEEEVRAHLLEILAPRNQVYITGDTHGQFERVIEFCARREVEPDRGRDGRGVWCRIPALGFQEEKRI